MKEPISHPKGEPTIAQGFIPGKRSNPGSSCKGDRVNLALQDTNARLPAATIGGPFRAIQQSRLPSAEAPGCSLCPFSIPNLAVARCNSNLAQYSKTPSLRVVSFEDEDDDEACTKRLVRADTP